MKAALALLGISLAIGASGPAYANGGGAPPNPGPSGPDISTPAAQAFLTALREHGIKYSAPDQVLGAAQNICSFAGDGKSNQEISNFLQNSNPALNADDAATFVTLAEQTYCPPGAPAGDAENPG